MKWQILREEYPAGSKLDCLWWDGYRTCTVKGYEGNAVVLETPNGGILQVDNLKALKRVDG